MVPGLLLALTAFLAISCLVEEDEAVNMIEGVKHLNVFHSLELFIMVLSSFVLMLISTFKADMGTLFN